MHAHKIKVTVPADHQLSVPLPDDFPAGPAEVIILAETPSEKQVVSLAGVLAPTVAPAEEEDPVADALRAFRQERQDRFAAGPDPEKEE